MNQEQRSKTIIPSYIGTKRARQLTSDEMYDFLATEDYNAKASISDVILTSAKVNFHQDTCWVVNREYEVLVGDVNSRIRSNNFYNTGELIAYYPFPSQHNNIDLGISSVQIQWNVDNTDRRIKLGYVPKDDWVVKGVTTYHSKDSLNTQHNLSSLSKELIIDASNQFNVGVIGDQSIDIDTLNIGDYSYTKFVYCLSEDCELNMKLIQVNTTNGDHSFVDFNCKFNYSFTIFRDNQLAKRLLD